MSDQHENRSPLDKLGEAAIQTSSHVGDKVRSAGEEAKRAVADTASSVSDAVKGALDRQIGVGAIMVSQCASSVRLAADDLELNSPMLGKLVRGFAHTLDNYAQGLQYQTSEQLVRSASDFARRKPALVFGIAALVGFVGFRTFKSAAFMATARNRPFESDDTAPSSAWSAESEGISGGKTGSELKSSSAFDQPYFAQPRSVVTGQHDAGSGANETPDGLNALEESMRQAAEDTPSGRIEAEEDVPVFDRGDMPPKI
jgi:hypothetical protein